uniref:Uncharacterized protein n=1 Tax=Brassica oleracea var. oleracea TaxID=109376 RepID=A0A0D3BKT4_BRAOL
THTATLVRGLNFTCLRLHGRIEGNVNELCAQLEKSRPIKVEFGNSNKKKRRSDYDSPHAAPVRRRKDVLQSKAHLQSMLMSRNGSLVEDFFGQLVGSVPDLSQHLHITTARILRHVNGYVDLILGEFKHYKHKACSRRHSTGGSKPPAGIWN